MNFNSIITRYTTKFIGTTFLVLNIFSIAYFLEIPQVAIWGVANSLVYLFSLFSNLTYNQFIDKFFPIYSDSKRQYYLYKFMKTISFLTGFWFLIIFLLQKINYFAQYNIDNLLYLNIMITFLVTTETSIELLSKYYLAIKKIIYLDISDFILSKFIRFFIFLFLLVNGYSVYYLLFTNLIIRLTFLLILIHNIESNLYISLKKIFFSKVKKNNFKFFGYTFSAYFIKILHTSFLNFAFLISTQFLSNQDVATFSLAILTINNSRPLISILSSLLSPILASDAKKDTSSDKVISNSFIINTRSIGIIVVAFIIFSQIEIFNLFVSEKYGDNFIFIVSFSILLSSISSLYIPMFSRILYSGYEKDLLIFTSINYLLTISIMLIFKNYVDFLASYLIFELFNFIFSRYLFRSIQNKFFKLKFGKSFPIIFIYYVLILLGLINFSTSNYIAGFMLIVIVLDLKIVFKIVNDFRIRN